MPLSADISSALQLLEHIQLTINQSDDVKLQAQTADDLNFLISSLENPILRSIVTLQDSLSELNGQLQQHPSILPVDFDIGLGGDLILSVPPPLYEADYVPATTPRTEFDDQRVPVAKLSQSSSGDSPSPQIVSPAPEDTSLPPITTPSYALEFQKAIEQSSHGREVQTIKLMKPEGGSLGFSVVGLKSEFEGELGIFVQEIQPASVAGRDGRLHEGDQILAIDGQPLDSNITHYQAINILQKARGLVELVIAHYDCPEPRPASAVSDSSKAGSDMLNTEWAQVEVIDLVNDGSGLGFGIIGGRSTGVVVKTILPGGVADRDGRLQSGDHILQIGEVNLRGMGSEQVAAVLRQSGSHVRLVVARPVEPTSPEYQALDSHAPIVPTKLLGDPEELDRHLVQNGYPEVTIPYDNYVDLQSQDALQVMDVVRPPLPTTPMPLITAPSLPLLTLDMLPPQTQLPEMEKFTVEIQKDTHGLGITIAGYVCEKEDLSGIFVKSISEGSAADLCKKIQVNDRIVEVDGKSLQGYSNFEAVDLLRATGQSVRLTLERYLRGPKFEQLQQAIANQQLKPPTPNSPSAMSLPKYQLSMDGESAEVEVEPEAESQTTIDSAVLAEAANHEINVEDIELLIDEDYDGPLKPTVEAAIKAKWNKILGPDVDIVVGQLCKFGEGGGLGISLEGTVDVEDGQEVRPHHYIRSILPEGPVGQNGQLKSGDELLEVNGHRLLGMNHIEVVSILKDLPVNVRMVCARRSPDSTPYRLIDTSQDKAAFAARSLLGGSLQNLIPAMERLVKAKSDGSLASTTTATTEPSLSKLKSRSLEPLTGLAMWSSEPHIIELVKGERGLGFSILDYQDPMNPSETVIVIRSLVPGGVAQMDGRLIPGDRLLSVNDVSLDHASLDQAVQALKGAAKGAVRIGVAKPLPIPDSVSHSQQEFLEGLSQATPTLDDHSMYSCSGSLPSDLEEDEAPPALPTSPPPDTDLLSDDVMLESHTPDTLLSVDGVVDLEADKSVPLPSELEQEIKIHKGSEPLGLSLDCAEDGDGMVVSEVLPGGAVDKDGRIRVGDLVLSINNESLRHATPAQCRAILRRAQLITTDINVRYVPAPTTLDYRKTSLQVESFAAPVKSTVVTQISPRIFPDYYRSPYITQEVTVQVPSVPVVIPSDQLSPTSVLSEGNESFVDCDSKRTDSLSDDREPFREPESDIKLIEEPAEAKVGESEVESEVIERTETVIVLESPLEKLSRESVESVESVVSDRSLSVVSGEIRRTSVIDPPSGFQTSSPSSREDLREELEPETCETEPEVCEETCVEVETCESEVVHPPIVEVPPWTRSDLRTSSKLFRGQSVDNRQRCSSLTISRLIAPLIIPVISVPVIRLPEEDEVDSSVSVIRRGQLLRSASTGQEVDAVGLDNMTVTNTSQSQSSVLLAKHWGPERNVHVLREPNCSLGISIVGGKVDLYNAGGDSGSAISGIFIKNVLPQSPAGRTNELKTGDRILEVDGIDLRTASHERAVEVIRAAGNPVRFLVQSLVQWSVDSENEGASGYNYSRGMSVKKKAPAPPSPTDLLKATPYPIPQARTPTPELIQDGWSDGRRQSQQGGRRASTKAPAPRQASVKKYSSSEESDDEEDTRDMEGRIYTKKGVEISRASAGNVKRTKEEIDADPEEEDDFGYTQNKVKKKYGNLGPGVVMVQLEKGHQGLGISLAGHKDRNRMAVFVCGINPKGSAFKTGGICVGDEILEVNGVVLHGRCHLNASAIIKGLPGPTFKVIVLRKDEGLESLAVKPITQFPVSLDDETPEQRYANFKGLRTVNIKKTGQGLGIMIIEGKHAEVGQGIFISDIQEGSAAEQAGLVVGDMILAVNKDTLLGSNYDAAAALLKKTEGVVTLVVCNPNKPKAEEKTDAAAPRSPTPQPPKEPEKPRLTDPATLAEEPPADPATAPVTPGKESTIEINKDKMGLGLSIVGGSDTLLGVIIIHEVYPDGAAAKDGRLKPGDQILEVTSEDFRSITHSKALAALRQTPAKVKMVVFRDEAVVSGKEEELMDIMEIELTKKPGKGLGLSIVGRKNGPGIFISDVVQGSTAGTDGRLMKGDQILSVNGQDLKNSTQEEAAAVLKTAAGKVTMKLGRLKARPGFERPPPVVTNGVSEIIDSSTSSSGLRRHFATFSLRKKKSK
ncbi:multiple PDZ domain protein-like isoform X4 [Macrosteles quadrilineatus]|uniref:multiple PDZ domain protein-like isoform X4 n=1 Tax=Macrosteles quadrilineatus TaxID=74068 RepID=UPI0023E2CE6F|nr:multiple PDZ domain protein-like isoform X4 [Macrosteles quadrilineatus]